MNINSSTTRSDWLSQAMAKLAKAGISSSHLDAQLIMEEVLAIDRLEIITNPTIQITNKALQELDKMLELRLKYIPIAYIRGYKEFFGRSFTVNSNVLIPRPESEAFVDMLFDLNINNANVLDVGCGSGCIGITIKLEFPAYRVILSDISSSALDLARKNAENLNAQVVIVESNLLTSISSKDDLQILVANLPYVPDNLNNKYIVHEPPLTLFAGKDGLDLYKRLWKEIKSLTQKPKYVFTESLTDQHNSMIKLANDVGYKLYASNNLVQLFSLI